MTPASTGLSVLKATHGKRLLPLWPRTIGANASKRGDGGWEQQQRVVHVEDEDGNIVAEDIAFNCPMIHCQSVIQRLREIQIAADPDAALALFIDELRTMRQDPIFKKESN
jgi:hypothetical protein